MTSISAIEGRYSKELIQAIGLFFLVSSSSEVALALQMARLLSHPNKLDPAAVLVLTGTENKVLLLQIHTLARCRLASAVADQVEKLCGQIRESFLRRNELAHLAPTPGQTPDEAILRPLKLKGDGNLQPPKPYTADQIREFAETLLHRVRQLDDILTGSGLSTWTDIRAALPQLTETKRPAPGTRPA